MQSPVPFLPVDSTSQLLSPLTPPLPPPSAASKRRPPAPSVGFGGFAQLDPLGDSGCGRGMTVFGSLTRGHSSHMAGAGHSAARRTSYTAPSQSQCFLDSSTSPNSSSPAASREGPIDDRRSFNGRRSTDGLHMLEDENRLLREELAQYKSEAIGLHRRPMAAIAGGGFRGPSGVAKTCMCDSLRTKLAKIRAELREIKEQRQMSRSQELFPMELRENALQPPSTAPASFTTAAHALASVVQSRSFADARTQTERSLPATAEASLQVGTTARPHEIEVQTTLPLPQVDFGVQAGSGVSTSVSSTTQTRPPRTENCATQVSTSMKEVATQFGPPAPTDQPVETASQTEPLERSVIEVEVQVDCPRVVAVSTEVQTECVPRVDAACEASIALPPKEVHTCSVSSQTSMPARSVAAVQTLKAPVVQKVVAATQVTPAPGIDCSTQAEDTATVQREAERELKLKELEARLRKMESENQRLVAENKDALEKAQAMQQMAQAKAFGQMNVTILCPRAECTVSGERVEMDSWNPSRLREEFEREVLPRFTRVFVEETCGNAQSQSKARTEAVDKAMQDFAETFRERLSAMLSAPNAAAAVQAAAAAKSGRSSR
mmetsp:Transcript_9919/g.15895  ORF Transcript_9919/g.15895 Transcript_9919/m.15895 type:complete len:606 (-) Transcript_9919:34-1851(-)